MAASPQSLQEDIAIIGMACVFPGAGSLDEYWQNIVNKVDAVGDPPPEWEANLYFDAESPNNDRTYCKRGGYLGRLASFDPIEHGVMPNALDGEPDQFLALKVASDALADAGISGESIDRSRVEVVLGRGTYINRGLTTVVQHGVVIDQVLRILRQLHPEHSDSELDDLKKELKASLPPFNAEVAPALVPNLVTGRIANRLDFMGPNYTIDAACASSLVALERGMQDLRLNACDMAVVGGVHASTPAPILMIFSQLGALSRCGQIRPFDERADGTLLGEGAGVLILKRRSDAEACGNRIYAVIKSVGLSSDGRATGLLAPRVEGEELAIRRAYEGAKVDAATIGLIEAHGTGTLVGDAAEIEALTRVFGNRQGPAPTCAIGSVKSMISHLMPAAGAAGVIKAALSLYHKALPPTLHCEQPNPKLGLEKSPFYISSEVRPWFHGGLTPRRAGVNAFGFGGINGHAVLEEVLPEPHERELMQTEWESEVLVLQGENRSGLETACRDLKAALGGRRLATLFEAACACNVQMQPDSRRLAIVASSMDDLGRKIDHALGCLADPACVRIRESKGIYYSEAPLGRSGGLAFMFPGEGSQYPKMLADVCLQFPEARRWFDLMDRAFWDRSKGRLPSEVVFPTSPDAQAQTGLFEMDLGPECVFSANQALLSIVTAMGIGPDAVVGHSTGEYSAFIAAGANRIENSEALIKAIRHLNAKYEEMAASEGIPEATLLAVGGVERSFLDSLLDGKLHVAMDNCPNQTVICGRDDDIQEASRSLQQRGALCAALPFRRAYHTPRFKPFCRHLASVFAEMDLAQPSVDIYSCVTAAPYPDEPAEFRRLATEQWASPVRFRETIDAMYRDGIRIFLEVGPKNHLTSFVGDTLRGKPHLALPCNVSHRSGLTQLNHMAGLLAAHGVDFAPAFLHRRGCSPSRESNGRRQPTEKERPLPTGLQLMRLNPSRRGKGTDSGAAPSAATLGGQRLAAPVEPVVFAPHPTPAPGNGLASSSQNHAMKQYLRTMDEFLEVQQAVMAGYFGGASGKKATARQSPLVGKIVSIIDEKELEAERTVSLAEDLFLADHAFGLQVSEQDPTLHGLAVMPLTMSVEIAAQAAALLAPGKTFRGMRDITAYQWIVAEEGDVTLRIRAHAISSAEVQVSISGPSGHECLAAVALFDNGNASPRAEGKLHIDSLRPSAWTQDRLYGEIMFHGPRFRAVHSMDGVGDQGAIATLQKPGGGPFFKSHGDPDYLSHPVLLDAAGQVVGFWIAERAERAFHIFPFRVDKLEVWPFVGDSLGRVRCQVAVRALKEDSMRSDIELVDDQGALIARLTGWEDRRFDLPDEVYQFRISPKTRFVSIPWKIPGSDPDHEKDAPSGVAFRIIKNVSLDMLSSRGRVWERVLAGLTLNREEQKIWREIKAGSGRSKWLLERIAVKDAIRACLQNPTYPADVAIPENSANFQTMAQNREVCVVASCQDGIAMAALADGGRYTNVGLSFGRLPSGSAEFDEGQLRLWHAHQALEQLGAKEGPSETRLLEEAEWTGETIKFGKFTARTFRDGDLIGAVSARERS